MAKTYLYLADGTRLEGVAFGSVSESFGEVVFSTGMTGYVESLTDPSFAGQILTFTYPMIGNYGVPKPVRLAPHLMENFESERMWVSGIVASEICLTSNFSDWCEKEHVPGICGIDTRTLTQKIREHGVMRGMISPSDHAPNWKIFPVIHEVARTSITQPIIYKGKKKHIVLLDCGVKHGILRALIKRGHTVTRIPWNADSLAFNHVDAVVCSNGPGDPKDCMKTVENIRKVLAADIPFLGICLGHQLLALAIGADTYKLTYGHRGLNQPCLDLSTKKAYVTSQNHGYAVDRKTIPADFKEWFINLNDETSEGIRHKRKPVRSVQFHPEGSPGPFDTEWIFDTL